MSELKRVLDLMDSYSAKNYSPLPVNIVEAQGCWVWTEPGRKDDHKYLDCLSAYGALNQGSNHPRIANAAIKQIETGVTVTSRAFLNTPMADLCKILSEVTEKEKVLLMNTGAEAVESAIKIARKWGYKKKGIPEGKAKVIVSANNFHGRTISIVGFSTEDQYKDGFGPFTPGFEIIPFGDIEALENAIDENTCAFMTEPAQGEAGIIFPPEGFLKKAKELCEKNSILLIADEIQSGFGRTGKLFCSQWENVIPDMYVLAKALGGGYPLSAVTCDEEVMGVLNPGDHGSTFGGNPFCSAIALEAVKIVLDEDLIENSRKMGEYMLEELRKIDSPYITDVRGRGLWIAIELNTSARPFCEKLQEEHHILCKETHNNIIRIAPPLTITKEEIDWALEAFRTVLLKS